MSRRKLLSFCLAVSALMVGYGIMKTNPAEAASTAVSSRCGPTRPIPESSKRSQRQIPETTRHGFQEARHGKRRILGAAGRADYSNTSIYIIAHKSREAAKKSWDEFRADPEWKKVAAESEADRQDRGQGGIRVHGPHRLFTGEIAASAQETDR